MWVHRRDVRKGNELLSDGGVQYLVQENEKGLFISDPDGPVYLDDITDESGNVYGLRKAWNGRY
jgi:hypothetical protein